MARRGIRSRPIVVLAALLAITLIVIDRSGANGPTSGIRGGVRDGFTAVGNTASWLWPFDGGSSFKDLKAQNASLQAQLDSANAKLATMPDAIKERDELMAINGLVTPDNVPKIAARIVSINSTNFDATIELSKGTNDNVRIGMPVVTGGGLVGRVVQSSRTRSTVLLATDTTSNIGIRFVDAGDVGIAVGQGSHAALRADLIDLDSKIKDGEAVVTSGLQHSLFPPGLLVGTVKSNTAGPHDLRRDVRLQPAVNLNAVHDVAVLQWTPPT